MVVDSVPPCSKLAALAVFQVRYTNNRYVQVYLSLVHALTRTAVRLVLATCSALTLCLIRRGVSRRYGFQATVWYTVFTVTQFHYPFWTGRTLPNMFALIPGMSQYYHRDLSTHDHHNVPYSQSILRHTSCLIAHQTQPNQLSAT